MDNNENNQQTNGTQYNGNQYNGQTQYNQPNYNQNQYQMPPMYQPPIEDTTPLSVGQWMLTTLVLALPCVGLIMAFVWGFGDGNVNRKNYCRSWLIWYAIAVVIGIIFYAILLAGLFSLSDLGSGYSNYYY